MNVAQMIQRNPAGFTKEAAEAEMQAILEKYQVDLVFVGITRNGLPAGGQFTVEPRQQAMAPISRKAG